MSAGEKVAFAEFIGLLVNVRFSLITCCPFKWPLVANCQNMPTSCIKSRHSTSSVNIYLSRDPLRALRLQIQSNSRNIKTYSPDGFVQSR